MSEVVKTGEQATEYAEIPCVGQYLMAHMEIQRLVAPYAESIKRAVDFGCGAGKSTRMLRTCLPATTKIIGVDISKEMVSEATARNSDPNTLYLVIPDPLQGKLPLDDGSVDLVVSTIVFQEFQSRHELESAIASISRCLKPGGKFVGVLVSDKIRDEDFTSFTYRGFPANLSRKDNYRACRSTLSNIVWTKDRHWSKSTITGCLRNQNMEDIAVRYPLAGDYPPYPMDKSMPWKDEKRVSPLLVVSATRMAT